MSSEHAHSYVHLFEECQTRIQTIGELLLIPCKPFAVFTHKEDLAANNDNFVRYRDQVISHLNKMLILSRDVSSHIHADIFQWKAFQQPLTDLTSTIVQLTQLSAHIAYLLALNIGGCKSAVVGPVASRHRLAQADLEFKFICTRLKHSRASDLNPHMLVDMCSTVTKCLSSMTEICREAADKIVDTSEQNQFKLCIKAITSTTSCLVSSVKSFKLAANDSHLQRVISFCQPVVSTSAALLTFATEEQFLGLPAELNQEAHEMFKSVIALAMSMVSACVQITKAARDLVHDPRCVKHKDRVSLCVESISRAASRLRDLLLSYEFVTTGELVPASYTKGEVDLSNSSEHSCHGDKENQSFPGGDVNNLAPSSRHENLKSEKSKSKRNSFSHLSDSVEFSHQEPVPALLVSRQAVQQAAEPSSSSSSSSSLTSTVSTPTQPIPNSSDDKGSVSSNSMSQPSLEPIQDSNLGQEFQERLSLI